MFPAASVALPDATLIAMLPLPVMPVRRTVGVALAPFSTAILPVAVPVDCKVMSTSLRSTLSAPLYVRGISTGPVRVSETDGAPMLSPGAVLSTTKVVPGPALGAVLPAASLAVPAAMPMPRVPSPVMPLSRTVGVLVVPFTIATLAAAVPV